MVKISLALCLVLVVASSVMYEAQGIFLLRRYLKKKFPQRCNDFTPYANKGMIMLVTNLENGCPQTAEFKNFFTEFKGYMAFIDTASATSKNVDVEMEKKCDGLITAMSALNGGKSEKSILGGFKSTMLSMGKTLIQLKKKAVIMPIKLKKELIMSMVKWTRMVASSVKAASEKKGKTINITVYQLDVDVNDKSILNGSSSSESNSSSEKNEDASSSKKGAVDDSEETSSKNKESSGKSEGASSSKKGVVADSEETTSKNKESSGKNEAASSSKKGVVADSEETSSKNKESGGSTSAKKESGKGFKDTTGGNLGSPSGSPPSS